MNELNPIEIWKHKKLLTLEQATFLIIGKDPSEYADASAGGWYGVEKPAGFLMSHIRLLKMQSLI
jgi:hypothetical protein